MYLVSLHGPGDVRLPGSSGAPTVWHGRDEEAVLADLLQGGRPHPGHDLHRRDDVRAVGDLDAELADPRAQRTHAERHDVHRAAAHATVEQGLSVARISSGATQLLVGPASASRSLQMKVRSSTRATSVGSEVA
jgi:hypothetical protein